MTGVREFAATAGDGTVLAGRAWQPAQPRLVLALVHGLAEHGGRYQDFALRAAAKGIATVAVDLRGHGRSPGERLYVERFDDYLLDVDALLNAADDLAAGAPLFLMGHSMGGAIVLRWLAQRVAERSRLRGIVLSSAALKIGPEVSRLLIALAPLLSRLAPRLRAGPIDPQAISRDPAAVAAYQSDPLVCRLPPPARTGAELLRVIAENRIAAATLDLPLCIFHGDADRLTDPGGSREIHAAWAGADKTLRLWPGSRHETLNDLDRDAVMDDLFGWLLARARPGSASC